MYIYKYIYIYIYIYIERERDGLCAHGKWKIIFESSDNFNYKNLQMIAIFLLIIYIVILQSSLRYTCIGCH